MPQAETAKNTLLSEHSQSVFSKIILDPEYLSSLENLNNKEWEVYENAYSTFLDQNHIETLLNTDSLKENAIKEKYLFLRAISFLKEGDTTSCVNILADLKRASDKQLANYSTEVLNTLKDPTRLNESNREAIEETPYIYNENSQHMLIFILPRKGVDVSFLKTLISDYNLSSYSTEIFEIMERKLYFYIMRPAMIATWLFGIILVYINGFEIFTQLWMHIKLGLVVILTIYHEYLGSCLKSLKLKTNTKTSKFFRIINEVPTIILIFIIFIVIFKPI